MTTVLAVYTSEAIANTREHVEQMVGPEALEAFEARHHMGASRVEAGHDVLQESLL